MAALYNGVVVVLALGVAYLCRRADWLIDGPVLAFQYQKRSGCLLVAIGFLIRALATIGGTYRVSRSRLYLGGNVLIFVGAALVLSSPSALVLVAILLPVMSFGDEWRARGQRLRVWFVRASKRPAFTPMEQYAWLCGSTILILVFITCRLVVLDGFVSSDKYVVAFVALGAVPLATAVLWPNGANRLWLGESVGFQALIAVNLAFILVGTLWFRSSFGLVATYVLAALVAVLRARRINYGSRVAHALTAVTWLLALCVPAVVLFWSLYPGNWYVTLSEKWAKYGSVAAIATLFLWWGLRASERNGTRPLLTWVVTAAAVLAPFAMMDAYVSYDGLHYTAYLSPAAAVAGGRVPLIEAFSQYGQSYLIYNLAFLFLPATYQSAALVTTVVNALYLLCLIVIMRKLVTNDWAFLVVAVTLPFFFWMSYHYSPNNTPSHGGFRYLPVTLLAASLVYMPTPGILNARSIAAICLAWAWSFEAAVYSTFIYVLFLVARGAVSETTAAGIAAASLRNIGRLVAVFAAFAGAICLVYLALCGSVPRYDLYLSLVLSYVGTDPFIDYTFYQDGFLGWVPLLLAYAIAIALIVPNLFSADPAARDSAARLAVVAGLGMTLGVYCLISTQSFILKPIVLPFFLLLYWALDATFLRMRQRPAPVASLLGLAPVFVVLFAVQSAVSAGRIVDKNLYTSTNVTVAEQLITTGRMFNQAPLKRARHFCSLATAGEAGDVCNPKTGLLGNQYYEFRYLLDRWQPDAPQLITFHPQDAVLMVAYQKPHLFPVSYSYVDGFSPQLYRYIRDRARTIIASALREGQSVVITKDLASLNDLQWALLKDVAAVWSLEELESTANLSAYRLVRMPGPQARVLALPDRPVRGRNSL